MIDWYVCWSRLDFVVKKNGEKINQPGQQLQSSDPVSLWTICHYKGEELKVQNREIKYLRRTEKVKIRALSLFLKEKRQ